VTVEKKLLDFLTTIRIGLKSPIFNPTTEQLFDKVRTL
jgi:hypothetical protein